MKVGTSYGRSLLRSGLIITTLWCMSSSATRAQDANKQSIKVPIVMEEATVRGKVAILETRREDRKVVEGLPVRVWSTKKAGADANSGKHGHKQVAQWERDELLHETETDELGLFDLPLLSAGEYLLEVSEVQFRLTVIPQSSERAGQSEPKVLLILVPKEVIAK
ncbi:MAG: hypothetical protein K8T26_20285 [Lentisphaerae bacterium]|nr:hypothetical protein [Lentisphaerota bacterium]